MKAFHLLLGTACIASLGMAQAAETLTVATVNNADMIRMQRLSKTFERQHPDIKLNWVVLEENVLRQRLYVRGLAVGRQGLARSDDRPP
jgi:sorbitol/mannitol transport system substrate-binding protein